MLLRWWYSLCCYSSCSLILHNSSLGLAMEYGGRWARVGRGVYGLYGPSRRGEWRGANVVGGGVLVLGGGRGSEFGGGGVAVLGGRGRTGVVRGGIGGGGG